MEYYVRVDYGNGYEKLMSYRHSYKINKGNYFDTLVLKEGEKVTDEKEIERISLSRTKRHIKELALCNEFEYFVTFTINKNSCDRFVLSECQDLIRKKLKSYKRKNSKFGYLLITEKHKNGGFHFHGFLKGVDISNLVRYTKDDYDLTKDKKIPYKLINSINRGDIIYHLDWFDNVGYNTLSPIRDYVASCMYIQKYITKDCVRNEHNQVYMCSRGLKKAKREKIMPVDLNKFVVNRYSKYQNKMTTSFFENDFVKSTEFFIDELNPLQKKNYTFDVIPKKEYYKTHIDF